MEDNKSIHKHDLLGQRELPADALYRHPNPGQVSVKTFISAVLPINQYPLFINGLAYTKWAAAEANHQLGLLTDAQYKGIQAACKAIIAGKHDQPFPSI